MLLEFGAEFQRVSIRLQSNFNSRGIRVLDEYKGKSFPRYVPVFIDFFIHTRARAHLLANSTVVTNINSNHQLFLLPTSSLSQREERSKRYFRPFARKRDE